MITFPTLPTARLTSPFGWRTHPVTGETSFHHGIDLAPEIAGTPGVPIFAVQDGVVRRCYYHTTMGNHVMIEHTGDEYSSVYMHMASYSVGVGDNVLAGQQIGVMGTTGRSTGIHLDCGISTDYPMYFSSPGTMVDPQQYLAYAVEPDPTDPPYYDGFDRLVRENMILMARRIIPRRRAR